MPKRSLVEQLEEAAQAMLARPEGKLEGVDRSLAPLVRIAADLRDLPRENFKARLKSDLERKSSMATVAEPIPVESLAAARQTAVPFLTLKDCAAAIEFYKKAFGAIERMRFEDQGRIPHAEIKIGNSTIFLADESPDYGFFGPQAMGGSPARLHLDVEDVDALAKRAIAAGAKVLRPVADQFYGDRVGHFADPFGYTWILSTRKEEMSLEEMHRRLEAVAPPAEKPKVNPVRKGFRTVTPYMVAGDGPALLEFAKQAFGAEEMFRDIGPAGGVHGEIRIGDSMIMIGGGLPGREFKGKPNTHAIHLYVEDVDAVYEKALAAGGTSIGRVVDQEYGERSGSVKDPAGNYWYIATSKGPTYVPKGLNNVNVYMHPLRAEPVIKFLKQAFGATEIAKYGSPEGVIHHAEVQVGTSVVEMGEAHGTYQPMSSMFYLYVVDCDMFYRRALAAGGTSMQEPVDQPYGDRQAMVKDAFGNQWCIATHIKDVA